MENVGCVIYTQTDNGISADWVFTENDKITRGTGIGIRLTELNLQNRFEGAYEIIYSDLKGSNSPSLKLIISFELGYYKLLWSNNGKTSDIGIGIENNNQLSAGWVQVNGDFPL